VSETTHNNDKPEIDNVVHSNNSEVPEITQINDSRISATYINVDRANNELSRLVVGG
jgi:hypothetical protein